MSRWTGSWLSGPGAAIEAMDGPARYRGERLGLPESGPGSVASPGLRFAGFLIDLVLASLVTSLFRRPDFADPASMSTYNLIAVGVWFAITAVGISLAGFTVGKALLGMRVVRMDGTALVGPLRGIPRTLLTGVILPAAVNDKNGRGLHDRLLGTIVLRTR
ncbi:RDD family protein [Alloactinosynnema sp. L-07]|uniref:RDD family protein n=1 Tax=Alloactinosynnema sp. L-07 TaxID=1653480 RepID=UPI0006B4E329|nr:RDD family protein [Alloactinosynnema sp. L-07]